MQADGRPRPHGPTCASSALRYRSVNRKSRRTSGRLFAYFARDSTMKPDIHPNYHMIKVVMTNGVEFMTRSTYGEDGRDAASGHRSEHPSGLDRRLAAAARSRRPAVALQHPLRRHWHRRQEVGRASPRSRRRWREAPDEGLRQRSPLGAAPHPGPLPASGARGADNLLTLVTSPPPFAAIRARASASGSLTTFMCQPLACSSVRRRA